MRSGCWCGMSVYDGKVIKLREMGFTDEVAARSALHESLGNVDKAIDRLMAGGDSTAKAKADLPVKRESALSAGGGSLASIFQRSQPSSASSQHVQARARQLSGAACRPAPATPSHQLKRSGTSLFGSKAKSPVMNQIWLSHGHQPSTKSVASSQEDRAPEVIPDSPEAGSGLRRPPPGGTTDERRVERTSAGVHADGDVKCDTAGHGSTSAKRRKLSASAPLSERMRPEDFSGLVGQSEAAEIVRGMAESGALQSVILWGPPGCGKTTLGRMMACAAGVAFVQLSAVHAGLAEVKKVVKDAQAARSFSGRGTVLFLDEIHRFNRVQQDAFLPHVESGLVTLVGATTENPSFALNKVLPSPPTLPLLHTSSHAPCYPYPRSPVRQCFSSLVSHASAAQALLSRCRVLALSKLSTEDTARLLRKAVEDPARGLPAFLERCAAGEVPGGTPAPASPGVAGAAGLEVRASDEVLRVVAVAADGDARAALNALEGALAHALRRRAREGAGGGPDGAGPAGDGAEAAGGGAEAAACSEAEAPSERRGAHAESSAGQEAPGEGGAAGREKSPDIWGPRGDRGGETDSPPVRDASSTAAETPMGASAGRGYASGGGGDGAEQGGNLDSPPFDDARAGRAGAAGARVVEVTVQDVREAAQRGHLVYDAAGDEHFNAISALHKCPPRPAAPRAALRR